MRVPLASVLAILAAGALVAVGEALASEYDERRAADVKKCEAIDAAASQSALYFNPDGYRSYYERSKCLQETAVRFRDQTLCAKVRQRRSLLSSSWGYSASRCRTLISEAQATDRTRLEELKARYLHGHVMLTDFRIRPNGNGRDFDIIPVFSGESAGGYKVTFEIVPDHARSAILFHSLGYYVDSRSSLQIFIKADDVRRRFPGFTPDRPYAVRATLILSVPIGDGDARWSDTFVERVFPARDRSQSIIKTATFPAR